MNLNYIEEELNKLPKNIKNNIIINKDTLKLPKTEFYKIVKSSEIQRLEDLLVHNDCINETSLYDIGIKKKKYDFNVIKIKKGTNIYKTFQGFPLEKDIISYSKKNLVKPSWFGNKYLCYAIARNDWGSIVSLKLVRSIYLIDYFDAHNLDLIFKLLKNIDKPYFNVEKTITTIKIATGYQKTLSEQILFLYKD